MMLLAIKLLKYKVIDDSFTNKIKEMTNNEYDL